jgi:3-methyladenine DNA glycosylase/8-oxoguanine DNA glycosylase
VTAAIELRPRGPYNLRMTLGAVRDGTVRLHDGGAELAYATPAGPAHARVSQRRDGTLTIALDSSDAASALDRLRFLLGVDDDIAPFLALADRDPLLSASVARARGLRAPRAGTCLHALIKALAGQLVTFSEARRIERAIVFRVGRPHAGLMLSPVRADLARLSAADVCASGLAPRRAAALVRISALLDLERLSGARVSASSARGRSGRSSSTASAATTAAWWATSG